MILSGVDIERYIAWGTLKIEPHTKEQFQQNGFDSILEYSETQDKFFHKGNFYLVGTRETITMPNDLMAFVELRSTWARRGLIIPPTIIDAGFRGNLTLEVSAFSDVLIPFGQRFAHIVFAQLSGKADPYTGKYQNQFGVTGPLGDI